ncbi:AMP-binding protein [Georgenia sp. SYP-B2076]|uniref:AMP-binding protein n=1 Tax=Georgenia sp. SYP-B2076 TaxID=2495881 RepID=UPI000F8E04BE|nr:AMP-binding protein [Georgenia sp. SYP-B2076]
MYPNEQARHDPERPAFIMADTGVTLTYGELDRRANQLAHLLRRAGLQRLDHVALFMENRLEFAIVASAAERTGLYYTPVNFHLTPSEAAWIINDSRAKVVVASAEIPASRDLPDLCPDVDVWLLVGADGPLGAFDDFDHRIADLPATPVADERLGTPMAYTGGSTGRPKGVIRPLPDVGPDEQLETLVHAARAFQLDRDHVVYLHAGPLYHAGPLGSAVLTTRVGGTNVVMPRFDAREFLAAVERYRVTHTYVVPTMMSRLLALPDDVKAAYDVGSFTAFQHGAAPIRHSVKRAIIDWFGPVVIEQYGSTEGNGMLLVNTEDWLARPGTVGRPLLGELVIRGVDGEELGPREIGEVWFRGATSFEYFNAPELTAEAQSADRNMSTMGDIGYVDEDGFLFLTDRKAFTIVSGGVNIYPQEIENVLGDHPVVHDVAVLGVPNEEFGQEVKAAVQLVTGRAGTPELESELIAYCRARLAAFKCPRSVDFFDELPRTETGKLFKHKLRDHYWAGSEGSYLV